MTRLHLAPLALALLVGCVLPEESALYPADDDDSATASAIVARDDTDGDGMTDSWENQNGYDPNDPTDATVDDDGDGRSALQEFTDETDPHQYDGPDSPFPTAPTDGSTVTVDQPDLTFLNATSPVGDPLTYSVEVYSDAALSTLLTSTSALAEEAGSTTWTVDVPLTEDAPAYWRVAASDPYVMGEWSSAVSFVVDALGAPPTVPVPVAPLTGEAVPAGAVTLRWADSVSADGLDLEYRVTLTDAAGAVEIDSGVVADTVASEEEWTVTQALASGVEYSWTVEAFDPAGRGSGASEAQVFGYDVTNDPPSAPAFVSPVDGAAVVELSPEVELDAGVDPEGGPVGHTLELSRDPNFAPVAWTVTADSSAEPQVVFDLAAEAVVLDEDISWYLRARATDLNGAEGPWAEIAVFVRGANGAPATPELGEPISDRVTDQLATFVVSPAEDPEGDAVRYELIVATDAGLGDVVDSGEIDGLEWQNTVPLAGGYWWSARAVDAEGAASAWAEPTWFVAIDPTWGCATAPGRASGWMILALLLGIRLRRRRGSGTLLRRAPCGPAGAAPSPRPPRSRRSPWGSPR